jgi:hypothetical protein
MTDFDWRAVLRTVAPTVATMIGGPLAGMAATVVGRVLLGRGDDAATSVAEAETAIASAAATPEGLIRLRDLQNEMEKARIAASIRLEEISASDRDSARHREAVVQDKTPRTLGILVVGTFLAYAIYATYLDPSAGTINLIIGWLGGVATSVITYYFGSSAGSRDKTGQMGDLMQTMAARPASPVPPSLPPGMSISRSPVEATQPQRSPSPPGLTADDLNRREQERLTGNGGGGS